MWEINEGNSMFLHSIELAPTKDLGCREPKVAKCRKLSMDVLLNFLVLGDASEMSGAK